MDDAGITFAYARSVATGAGPVLQPGAEAVEGYSNPAWLALLVVARWLGLFDHGAWFGVPDYVAFPKLLALVLVAATFACCYAAAAALSRHPVLVTVIAGTATAAVPSFVVWTVSGLENALLALAVTALGGGARPRRRRRPAARDVHRGGVRAAGRARGADPSRRPGLRRGVPPRRPPAAARAVSSRRAAGTTAVGLAAFAVPIGAYLAWRLATFGESCPTRRSRSRRVCPGPAALARPGELVGYVGWLAALLVALCVGAALAAAVGRPPRVRGACSCRSRWPSRRSGCWRRTGWSSCGSRRPSGRSVRSPAAVAAVHVAGQLTVRGRVVGAVLAVAAAVASAPALVDAAREFRAAPTAPLCLVAQNTGRTVNAYARIVGAPDATLLAPDIGGAALTSDLRVTDLVGLADRADRPLLGGGRHGRSARPRARRAGRRSSPATGTGRPRRAWTWTRARPSRTWTS